MSTGLAVVALLIAAGVVFALAVAPDATTPERATATTTPDEDANAPALQGATAASPPQHTQVPDEGADARPEPLRATDAEREQVGRNLREALKYTRNGYRLDYGFLRRSLEALPGGLHHLIGWSALRTHDEDPAAELARALIRYGMVNRPWQGFKDPEVERHLLVCVTGEVQLPSPARWLEIAALVRRAPATAHAAAETEGLRLAAKANFPALVFDRLAALGVATPGLAERLVTVLHDAARSGSKDVMASWTPGLEAADLVEIHGLVVPEAVVRSLEGAVVPAYRAIGLRLRTVQAKDERDLQPVFDALRQRSFRAPHREWTLACLMRRQPALIASKLPALLRRASSVSYFRAHVDKGLSRNPAGLAKGLESGVLVWDVEARRIRRSR